MPAANTFGEKLSLTTFGESHGVALGAIVDGVPAGLPWSSEILEREIARRKPGTSKIVSARGESDQPEILSGVHEGLTLGTPIAVVVRNHDARSEDYAALAAGVASRPGHADDLWRTKFGHSDLRGGGRSSGRETVARVIGGAVARMILQALVPDFKVTGFANQIGPFSLDAAERENFDRQYRQLNQQNADHFTALFPSPTKSEGVEKLLLDAKIEGRSYGGTAELWLDGAPVGLGQPVFRKLKADLASAMMSVGATSSFEIGAGFEATRAEGSEFHRRADALRYGGIRGGISTGERIVLRVGFKPTSSVLDVAKKGRHDPCIVPRAIPVLEAMACFVLADHLLWSRTDRIS